MLSYWRDCPQSFLTSFPHIYENICRPSIKRNSQKTREFHSLPVRLLYLTKPAIRKWTLRHDPPSKTMKSSLPRVFTSTTWRCSSVWNGVSAGADLGRLSMAFPATRTTFWPTTLPRIFSPFSLQPGPSTMVRVTVKSLKISSRFLFLLFLHLFITVLHSNYSPMLRIRII